MAWNAPRMGRDGVPVGCTTGVVECNNRAAMHKVSRADEEVGCNVATDTTVWGGVGTTA